MKRKAVSSLVSEAVLLMIVLVAGLAVYGVVSQRSLELNGGASVAVESAYVQSLGSGLALLSVRVENTGSVPELVAVYVSGLSPSYPYAKSYGFLYFAYEDLPGGSYSFSAYSVYIKGPSTGYRWERFSGSASLSSGAYEIAVYGGPSISTDLPESTRWAVAYYAVPQGDSLALNQGQPWNLSAFGAVVLGEGTAFGSSPSYSGSNLQPGIPLGVLEPGQTRELSVLISGSYWPGQSVTVIAEAWTPSGSAAASSASSTVF